MTGADVRLISSTELKCYRPVLDHPFRAPSYVEVSIDGQVYSQTLVPYAILGDPVALMTRMTSLSVWRGRDGWCMRGSGDGVRVGAGLLPGALCKWVQTQGFLCCLRSRSRSPAACATHRLHTVHVHAQSLCHVCTELRAGTDRMVTHLWWWVGWVRGGGGLCWGPRGRNDNTKSPVFAPILFTGMSCAAYVTAAE